MTSRSTLRRHKTAGLPIDDSGFSYSIALFARRLQNRVSRRSGLARIVMGAHTHLRQQAAGSRPDGDDFHSDLCSGQFRATGRMPSPQEWSAAQTAFENLVERGPSLAEGEMLAVIAKLCDAVGLGEAERRIFTLTVLYYSSPAIEGLYDQMRRACPRLVTSQRVHHFSLEPHLLAVLLDLPAAELRAAMSVDGSLLGSGLVRLDDDGGCHVLTRALRLIRMGNDTLDMRAALLRSAGEPALSWDMFGHVAEAAARAADLLRAAAMAAETGVNILLHGPPGTGKTSLAGALAAHAGLTLYNVGLTDGEGDEPSRTERLGDLLLAQRLLRPGGGVLLFDEAEDLLAPREFHFRRPAGSRVFLNRLMERTSAPIIWTANDTEALGERIVRRMMFCVEMRRPPRRVLAGMWRRTAAEQGLALADKDADRLAALVPAAPALVGAGVRMARLTGGGAETALAAVQSVARAMHGAPPPVSATAPEDFDPALINADHDVAALVERLAAPGAPREISLLLEGPPGSGKSALVRHLARRMGLELVQKRASDLLDPYVGGTEARIARAFAEAREEGVFLVFDEADSLLAERSGAVRRWEVSQVNEMLTWMESHALPFACTTNLGEALDRASLRRFLVKLRFGYMSRAQAAAAFTAFFGLPVPPGLADLGALVPADFALVRRRLALTGELGDPRAILAGLTAEAAARPGAPRPIGFARGS
jgi:AAA+ superfamily predicted ATPase